MSDIHWSFYAAPTDPKDIGFVLNTEPPVVAAAFDLTVATVLAWRVELVISKRPNWPDQQRFVKDLENLERALDPSDTAGANRVVSLLRAWYRRQRDRERPIIGEDPPPQRDRERPSLGEDPPPTIPDEDRESYRRLHKTLAAREVAKPMPTWAVHVSRGRHNRSRPIADDYVTTGEPRKRWDDLQFPNVTHRRLWSDTWNG